jgi:hypothetical protein
VVAFSVDRLTLLGELRYFAVISDRGTKLERGFCPICGNSVRITPARPDMIFIQAASLDDPSLYKPASNIWVRSAVPWDIWTPRCRDSSERGETGRRVWPAAVD